MNNEKMPAIMQDDANKNAGRTARAFNAALRALPDFGLIAQTKNADGVWQDLHPLEFRVILDVTSSEYRA